MAAAKYLWVPMMHPTPIVGYTITLNWCLLHSNCHGVVPFRPQVRCGTPVRLALSCAVTAASCLWSAIILACGLTFGMLWGGHLLMQGCSFLTWDEAGRMGVWTFFLTFYKQLVAIEMKVFWNSSSGFPNSNDLWIPLGLLSKPSVLHGFAHWPNTQTEETHRATPHLFLVKNPQRC